LAFAPFSFGGYRLALAALALVVLGAYDSYICTGKINRGNHNFVSSRYIHSTKQRTRNSNQQPFCTAEATLSTEIRLTRCIVLSEHDRELQVMLNKRKS